MGCIDDELLLAVLEGEATPQRLAIAFAHGDDCEACAKLLASVARARATELDTRSTEAPRWSPGDRLGRFVIQARCGSGGMGLVLKAHDPLLRRTVALKVLHVKGDGAGVGRVLREARAMAKVRHPNVVAVHEIGHHEGQPFIVMDYVEGDDLRTWLRAQSRPWTEIVRALVEAGQGLAAAHRRGIVHRDFKPANVLVGIDGSVKVTDFGLGCANEDTASQDAADAVTGVDAQTRSVVGTPRYMAPEQAAGETTCPRTDQFSFCVAAYEALSGRHPFGSNAFERRGRARARQWSPLAHPDVPRVVAAAIETGLDADPFRRHSDMDGLTVELRRGLTIRTRRRRWFAGAAVVVGALGVGATLDRVVVSPSCALPQDGDMGGVWTEASRGTLVEAAPGDAGASLVTALDRYARSWNDQMYDVCVATRGTPPPHDRIADQRRCLGDARAAMRQSIQLLTQDPSSGIELVKALPSLSDCERAASPARPTRRLPDPASRDRINRASAALAEAAVLVDAREVPEALSRLERIEVDATQIDWPPLAIRHLQLRAEIERSTDPGKALEYWREAYRRALAFDEPWLLQQVELDGVAHHLTLGDLDESRFLFQVAAARESRTSAAIVAARGRIAAALGDFAEAEDAYRELVRRVRDDPSRVGDAYGNLASAMIAGGRLEEASSVIGRAIDASIATYGPSHPATVAWRANRAALASELGRDIEAERELRELRVTAPDTEMEMLADFLALVLRRREHFDEARAFDAEVVDRREQRLGARHPATLQAIAALALDLIHIDRAQEAEELLVRAANAAGDPATTVEVAANLALARRALQMPQPALEAVRVARPALDELAGEQGLRAVLNHQHGLALMEAGRPLEAVAILEQAYELARADLRSSPRSTPRQHYAAEVALSRAQVLARVGRANEVDDVVAETMDRGWADEPTRATLCRWIAEHDPKRAIPSSWGCS